MTRPPGPAELAGPTQRAPARRPGSIRRTTSLDLLPDPDGALTMAGRARDLVTRPDGSTLVTGTGLLSLLIGSDRRVASASLHPYADRAPALVGRSVVAGFRTAVYRALPERYDAGSPLHLLLDDVAGGVVISGFTRRSAAAGEAAPAGEVASAAASAVAPAGPPASAVAPAGPVASAVASTVASARTVAPAAPDGRTRPPVARRLDVCIGWARDSDAARQLAHTGIPPAPDWTPPAPELYADDPIGSHTTRSLPAGGMRRARRLDIWRDATDPAAVHTDLGFRDTFVDGSGTLRILHEYSARLTSVDGWLVSAIEVTPHVLPHLDCPLGAASAARVVGHQLGALREWVSLEFFGPSTCTHLNDLLRGLSDVPTLDTTLTASLQS